MFPTDKPMEYTGLKYNILFYSPDENSDVFAQVYDPITDDVIWEKKLKGYNSVVKSMQKWVDLNYQYSTEEKPSKVGVI